MALSHRLDGTLHPDGHILLYDLYLTPSAAERCAENLYRSADFQLFVAAAVFPFKRLSFVLYLAAAARYAYLCNDTGVFPHQAAGGTFAAALSNLVHLCIGAKFFCLAFERVTPPANDG